MIHFYDGEIHPTSLVCADAHQELKIRNAACFEIAFLVFIVLKRDVFIRLEVGKLDVPIGDVVIRKGRKLGGGRE